jgi:hypothetical protein
MAIFTAEIQAVQCGSFFKVTVDAGSAGTAVETIKHIYRPTVIRNLRQISSKSNTTDVAEATSGMYWFLGVIFSLYLIVAYWYVVIPIVILIGLAYWWCAKD